MADLPGGWEGETRHRGCFVSHQASVCNVRLGFWGRGTPAPGAIGRRLWGPTNVGETGSMVVLRLFGDAADVTIWYLVFGASAFLCIRGPAKPRPPGDEAALLREFDRRLDLVKGAQRVLRRRHQQHRDLRGARCGCWRERVFVCGGVCVSVCLFLYVCVCVCMYVSVCMYVCVCVCV